MQALNELFSNPIAVFLSQLFVTLGVWYLLTLPTIRIWKNQSTSNRTLAVTVTLFFVVGIVLTMLPDQFEYLQGLGVEIGGGVVTALMIAYFVKFFERFEKKDDSETPTS